uniref:WD repeat-containing protein 60 n=1 Tax=Heliothis virescens TaxID=7102 RepID=A0A2A4JEP5_HELVI
MQTTVKKPGDAKPKRDKVTKDETTKVPQDDKLKKTTYASTPRNFVQKSTTADIYGQKKKSVTQTAKTPKKSNSSNTASNVSPMKDLLKSSPSSTIQSARSESKMATPKATSSRYSTPRNKDFGIAVNSPIVKRKLNMDLKSDGSFVKDLTKDKKERERSFIRDVPKDRKEKERSFIKDTSKSRKEKDGSFIIDTPKSRKEKERSFIKEKEVAKERKDTPKGSGERQRTKTRTLDESEVKMLNSNAVNNSEMLNLAHKLSAKPKAFYIELDDEKPSHSKKTPPSKVSSDEDMSYEDDFESYESDFDSYHSSVTSEQNASDERDEQGGDDDEDDDSESEAVETSKEVKDDENMLDSGSFDLRDRSANKLKPAVLDFILETAEVGEKPSSLTDEGFQEMSSSSAVSSIRTVHTDVLDRPLFIDFTKSKETRRRKRIGDRLRQRAKDLLSIITLHEMSYSLFEMKPISYDLYMATFGRSNYTQVAVQTFEDGISEEVQTDEVECEHKWTQHPVEFTKNDICIKQKVETRKYSKNMEDYLTKFTFLTTPNVDIEINNAINVDASYNTDPLRIYFEQKDGVGPSEMLPYETYKSKLKNKDYNTHRLGKFLKKIESRISNVLNTNSGNTELTELNISKYPFSKGSLHLWDLSEEPTWRDDVASDEKSTKLEEINEEGLTDLEKQREWNNKNINVGFDEHSILYALQSCAFTNSAYNMCGSDVTDRVVGLELTGDAHALLTQEGGRRIVGQVVTLQSIGVLTIWSIVQQKSKTVPPDIGKAYWSKMKLEKNQSISILDHIDLPLKDPQNDNTKISFNLNAAKRRILNRKQEKLMIKKEFSRPKSAISFDFDIDSDRPSSAASAKIKRVLSVEKDVAENWESGVVCGGLKIMNWKDRDNYLIAKNCGEVLCCKRILGSVRVNKFCVATDASSVTCIEVSPHRLPYFLAATDTGTISVCSLIENRVLLTLDCRNIQPKEVEKYQSDHKGRYISSVSTRAHGDTGSRELMLRFMSVGGSTSMAIGFGDGRHKKVAIIPRNASLNTHLSVTSLSWSHINPCCVFASLQDDSIVEWELSFSDIYAKCAYATAARSCKAGESTLALLTPEGEVQVHKLTNEHRTKEFLLLFEKYLALL